VTFNYARPKATAARLVAKFGQPCTIRRASSEPDEPQNPWEEPADPANDPVDYQVVAIEDVRDIRDMNGTLIGTQKRTLTIDATGVQPLKSDVIAVGVAKADVAADTVFEEIIAVKPLAPSGVALLYELELSV
jgi:hypothetical protein